MNSSCCARSNTASRSLSAVARRCVFSSHSSFKFGKLPIVPIDAGYVLKDIYVFDFCFCNRSALGKRNQMVFVDVAVLVLGLLFNSFRCVCYLILFFFSVFQCKVLRAFYFCCVACFWCSIDSRLHIHAQFGQMNI